MGTKLALASRWSSRSLWRLFFPVRASSQERLKVIYSQFTMTNSATWFAREAGLFERHGLMADLVLCRFYPGRASAHCWSGAGRHDVRRPGRRSLA